MSIFEIPRELSPDLYNAMTTLRRYCETVQGWGVWHDVPFDAANFTPLEQNATWMVSADNVKSLKYEVVNKTMTIAFDVIQCPAVGTISALRIALPLPFECVPRADAGARLFTNACIVRQDLGLHVPGVVSLRNDPAGRLVLVIERTNGQNINVVGEAGAFGQITVEVRHQVGWVE